MFRSISTLFIAGLLALGTFVPDAVAGDRRQLSEAASTGGHPNSGYYRGGPQVRGYVARRGGYSYNYAESVNTYGDARSKYGAASSLRNPMLDKQTRSGPFDHGFFYDSGVAPRGGDAPYMN